MRKEKKGVPTGNKALVSSSILEGKGFAVDITRYIFPYSSSTRSLFRSFKAKKLGRPISLHFFAPRARERTSNKKRLRDSCPIQRKKVPLFSPRKQNICSFLAAALFKSEAKKGAFLSVFTLIIIITSEAQKAKAPWVCVRLAGDSSTLFSSLPLNASPATLPGSSCAAFM